jgi:hypothetical protein
MQTTQALHRAVDQAQHSIYGVLAKARFWQRFAGARFFANKTVVLSPVIFAGSASCLFCRLCDNVFESLPDIHAARSLPYQGLLLGNLQYGATLFLKILFGYI